MYIFWIWLEADRMNWVVMPYGKLCKGWKNISQKLLINLRELNTLEKIAYNYLPLKSCTQGSFFACYFWVEKKTRMRNFSGNYSIMLNAFSCVVKKSCLMKMQIANNLIDGADWAAKFLHFFLKYKKVKKNWMLEFGERIKKDTTSRKKQKE